MAKLGSPQTKKFFIGTAEVRLGPLSSAGRLTQAHSVGLVDSATIEVTQDSVDLLGGFPQVLQDTAIVNQSASLTATLREFSHRNLNVLLGEGVPAATTDVSSLVVNSVASGDLVFNVTTGDGANFTVGDTVAIYRDGQPESVTVSKIAGIATDALTMETGLGAVEAYDGTADTINIFVVRPVAIGAITGVNYFSVQILMQERSTARPMGYNFWKSAISSGMNLATNATDFSSTDLQLKFLQPAASEYASGQPLAHLSSVIPTNPTGMQFISSDAA